FSGWALALSRSPTPTRTAPTDGTMLRPHGLRIVGALSSSPGSVGVALDCGPEVAGLGECLGGGVVGECLIRNGVDVEVGGAGLVGRSRDGGGDVVGEVGLGGEGLLGHGCCSLVASCGVPLA